MSQSGGKKAAGGDYEVGYGKPPKHTQFKPGQSGNPKGAKKPQLTFDEMVAAELEKKTKIKVGGEILSVKKKQALAKRIVADALGGDRHALKLALSMLQRAESRSEGEALAPLTADEMEQLMQLLKEGGDDGDAG